MDGPYKNLDEKIKQKPSETIYGIYTGILRAIKEEGLKAEKNDNITIIDIGDPKKGNNYLTIVHNQAEERTEIHYRISGKSAKEVAMGIGRHFPILEEFDKLVENLSHVEVWTHINNKGTKCESNSEYCRKVRVDIYMVGKPHKDSEQYETQSQPPTELGVELAKSFLEKIVDLAANGKIKVSVFGDGTTYINQENQENEEPIIIYRPSDGRVLQSYTVSGESAEDLMREIGRYIPLPKELKETKNVRVTWEYTPQGYIIGVETEIEPRKSINIF